METHSNRLLVFSVVGALLMTLIVFAAWLFSANNPDGRDYLIRFNGGVSGLGKGSPVTFSGMPAGVVTSVTLADNDPSTALVMIRLDREIPVVRGVTAAISRSLIGDGTTVTLDGAENGAPPIEPLNGEAFAEIPAKKGGLLGSGGDPMALIDKISRSVDNVSANLGPSGQRDMRERLASLARTSERWSGNAARMSETITGAQGRIAQVGGSIASAGEQAERLNAQLRKQRGTGMRAVNDRLLAARRGLADFEAGVRAARPAVASAETARRAITDQVRDARVKTRGLADRAQQIDSQGLQVMSPKLPDYVPREAGTTPPNVPPPSR